jgi:hypothetical protein
MRTWIYAAGAGVVAAVGAGGYFITHRSPQAQLSQQWGLVGYCKDCHNDADFTAELSLDHRHPDNVVADPAVWEKVVHKLEIGAMPPRTEPQPPAEMKARFLTALTGTLDAAAAAHPYAGSTTVHRLNRAEYANAVRDLLGVQADLADQLPSDGADFGFDNIAQVLTTTPFLLDRYLTVALRVADMAIGNPGAVETAASYPIPFDLTQDYRLPGMPLGTRGGTTVHHIFPADGEYVFSGRLFRGVEEGLFGVEGHDRPNDFLVLVDGKTVYSSEIAGKEDHELAVEKGQNAVGFSVDKRLTSPPIPVTAGPHDVTFTWLERTNQEQNSWQPSVRASMEIHNPSGLPRLENVVIQGPRNVTGVSETPSRKIVFVCRPETEAQAPACAKQILTKLAHRAFRRPVTDDDIQPLFAFYERERTNGGNFDDGIRAAVARLLVSPWFLFRVETNSPDVPPGSNYRISDVELASRLSFFLWSSIPDEQLQDLAEQNKLHDPNVLQAQVERMLQDKRSDALVDNFVGQWLQLRNLESRVKPDFLLYPDFDGNLRNAFRTETQMLFAHVLREGRPVQELMTANYTFVNERLARHYKIPGVYGERFRKVEIKDPRRWGLFGQGSIESLTSAGSRTSPIIRGKFIVTEFWDNPPPAPPPNVPPLEQSKPKNRPTTVREQLELHRANPNCASCHTKIDPVGFALENFDADGSWRDKTRDGLPIDSAGVLADGTKVDGPVQLREALLKDPNVFVGTVTKKMLIYALGRGLEPQDMPVVRSIVRNAAKQDYSLKAIVFGVIDSYPFQMRMNGPQPATATVAQARE